MKHETENNDTIAESRPLFLSNRYDNVIKIRIFRCILKRMVPHKNCSLLVCCLYTWNIKVM